MDISATRPEGTLSGWILALARDRSVRSHSQGIIVPSLEDSTLVAAGFDNYKEMCVSCHGAPGVKPDEIARGLNPPAPELSFVSSHRSAAETFYIIKNGLKMTAMPAWGPTHSDSAVWGMVAFVRRLPETSPEMYQAMQKAGQVEDNQHDHHDHSHSDHQH